MAQIVLRTNQLPGTTGTVLGIVLVPEVFGAAILWAAMIYYWFGFDDSHWLTRAFWFVCLCSVLPLFWTLYYFLVYRKRAVDRAEVPSLAPVVPS